MLSTLPSTSDSSFSGLDLRACAAHAYLGHGAGKPIQKALEDAQDSITIMVPFISASKLRVLLDKQNEGVEVTLICHDIYGLGSEDASAEDLLEQRVQTDPAAKRRRGWALAALVAGVVLCLGLGFAVGVTGWVAYLGTAVLTLCMSVGGWQVWRMPTVRYSYRPRLDVFRWMPAFNDRDAGATMHAKVYVVDGTQAWLGSLNATYSGFTRNIESRVDVVDTDAIRTLCDHVQAYAAGLSGRSLDDFARTHFTEPPHGRT